MKEKRLLGVKLWRHIAFYLNIDLTYLTINLHKPSADGILNKVKSALTIEFYFVGILPLLLRHMAIIIRNNGAMGSENLVRVVTTE